MTLIVKLNGTDENPYHKLGLLQNPFPQIANSKYSDHVFHLQKLGSDPVPDVEYIRNHLKGWDPRFIDICCEGFRKGEMVIFEVSFPE